MNETIRRAVYDTAHKFKGGVQALATVLGVSPGVLYNKTNPTMDSHKVHLEEALSMMLATGDFRILYALAQETQHTCVSLGNYENCSDMELLDLALKLNVRRGEVDREIRDALKDGRVSHEEKLRIRGRMQAAMRAQMELFSRIDALAEALPEVTALRTGGRRAHG